MKLIKNLLKLLVFFLLIPLAYIINICATAAAWREAVMYKMYRLGRAWKKWRVRKRNAGRPL